MKKKDVISLIRYHVEGNDEGFRNQAYEIVRDFDASGDYNLAEYVMGLLSNVNTFDAQSFSLPETVFLEHMNISNDMLLLPEPITKDIIGVVNAVEHKMGVNRFIFSGKPGTGKTEASRHLARLLKRELFMVDFSTLIDSKLGQTQKNLKDMFTEIESFSHPEKIVILFDELDALAMDRTNQNDLREMGRATSTLLKYLERVDDDIVIVATTNLIDHFDKALIRRFDTVIDFNRYERSELLEISERLLSVYIDKLPSARKDIRLFRKIVNLFPEIPYPGDLKNIIKTAVAFSDPDDDVDYFRRLYSAVCGHVPDDISEFKDQGFTVREIAILSGKSKSSVARDLKEF